VTPIVEVTMDCANAATLGRFWQAALGYAARESPDGVAWLYDPAGQAPFLCLLEVPEPKTTKNRLHFDLNVSGDGTDEEKSQRIAADVERLRAAGASVLKQYADHVTMADPEGNEFDVC
jgi:hypothetical protein